MLVWILGVGFIYYQKYVVRIATNDLAKKVAVTYDSPDSDIVKDKHPVPCAERKSDTCRRLEHGMLW